MNGEYPKCYSTLQFDGRHASYGLRISRARAGVPHPGHVLRTLELQEQLLDQYCEACADSGGRRRGCVLGGGLKSTL